MFIVSEYVKKKKNIYEQNYRGMMIEPYKKDISVQVNIFRVFILPQWFPNSLIESETFGNIFSFYEGTIFNGA